MTESQQIIDNLKTAIKAAGDILGILEKAEQPAEHVWEHGDVFESGAFILMYLYYASTEIQIVYLNQPWMTTSPVEEYLRNAKFLFNIKEKLNG